MFEPGTGPPNYAVLRFTGRFGARRGLPILRPLTSSHYYINVDGYRVHRAGFNGARPGRPQRNVRMEISEASRAGRKLDSMSGHLHVTKHMPVRLTDRKSFWAGFKL